MHAPEMKPAMRTRAISLFVSVLAVIPLASCKADVIAPCALPNGVTPTSLTDAPAALVQALRDHVGELAAPGIRFDATDVVGTGRNRRLIFIWHIGSRWIVATEHGGIGYNDPIFAYDLSDDGGSATLVQESIAFPNTVCPTAASLISFRPRTQ
jgi:hypothetical protein